jgi:PhnB protein
MRVDPYLFFFGRCEDAIAFYRNAVGAEVDTIVRYKDAGAARPGTEDKVMHASLLIGASTVLASDGQCSGYPRFDGISLSLSTSNDVETMRFFEALAVGGTVRVPLMQTPFASRFGMVADRFGVLWTVVTQ